MPFSISQGRSNANSLFSSQDNDSFACNDLRYGDRLFGLAGEHRHVGTSLRIGYQSLGYDAAPRFGSYGSEAFAVDLENLTAEVETRSAPV